MVSKLTPLEWASNIAQIVGLTVAVPTLWYAWRQLKKAANSSHAQLVLALDAALAPHLDTRENIGRMKLPDKDDTSRDAVRARNQVRRYIAVFERMGMLVKTGELDIETVDKFYADRIVIALKNEDVRKLILNGEEAWSDFIYLWEELKAMPGTKREWPGLSVPEDTAHAIGVGSSS